MKLKQISANHQIQGFRGDLFAISDIGGLIAQFKDKEIVFYKIDGKFHHKITMTRRFVQKICWIGSNLIFIALYFVQIFNYKQEEITDRIHIEILGYSIKKDKLLIITSNECHIYKIEQNKFVIVETCSFSRASNKFNFIESLISKEQTKTDLEQCLEGFNLKSHEVRNELRNQLIEIEQVKSKEVSLWKTMKKTTFMIKNHSVSGTYRRNRLKLKYRGKYSVYTQYPLRCLRMKGEHIIFSTERSFWHIHQPYFFTRYASDVYCIEIHEDVAFILTSDRIIWLGLIKEKEKDKTSFLIRNGIYRFRDRIEDMLPILEDFHSKKIIMKFLKMNFMNVQKYFEKHLKDLCASDLDNKNIVDELEPLINEYKISNFHDLAIIAQLENRIPVTQFLIIKEGNFLKRMDFCLRFGYHNGIIKSVIEQDNILLVNNFFFEMHKKITVDEIIKVTKNEKVFVKYKNFLKHFKDKYLDFLNKCQRYQDIIYDNLLKSSVDLTKLPEKKFDSKIFQILYKFYFLREAIFNDQGGEDISTVDSAVKLLLENNDKKNAFLLKYSSVMSKEKFKHLKETLLKKHERA